MKKCAVLILLFGAAFSLYAQNTESVAIYVPEVNGVGATSTDNAAITNILIRELKARNIDIKETREETDFALIGTLAPSNAVAGNMLSLALQDQDGFILYEQVIFYATVAEANVYISTVLLNMLSSIFTLHVVMPVEEPVEQDDETWRNKLWYIGANVFWNPRIYYGTKTEFFPFNFGVGFSGEFHLQKYATGKLEFLKYFAVGTGFEFVSDWVVASARSSDEYRNSIMQIPITVYGVLKPGSIFLLQPYLGISFNIPFLPETTPFLLSGNTGFQFGINVGKGVAYADIRFAMDFGKSGLSAMRPRDTRQYNRYMMYLGVGYKYDLVEPAVEFIKKTIQNIKNRKAESARKPEESADEEAFDEAAFEEAFKEAFKEEALEEAAEEQRAEEEAAIERTINELAIEERLNEAAVEEALIEAGIEKTEDEPVVEKTEDEPAVEKTVDREY